MDSKSDCISQIYEFLHDFLPLGNKRRDIERGNIDSLESFETFTPAEKLFLVKLIPEMF